VIVDVVIVRFIQLLDRNSYKFIGCGTRGDHQPLVIVLDEAALRQRSLLEIFCGVLNGPDVWAAGKDLLDPLPYFEESNPPKNGYSHKQIRENQEKSLEHDTPPPMARGRPRKRIRNTAGLGNQAVVPQLPNPESFTNDVESLLLPDDSDELIHSSSLDTTEKGLGPLGLNMDSTRFLINEDDGGMESGADVEEALVLCGDWEDKDPQKSMVDVGTE